MGEGTRLPGGNPKAVPPGKIGPDPPILAVFRYEDPFAPNARPCIMQDQGGPASLESRIWAPFGLFLTPA
jgi:hypothetical protein